MDAARDISVTLFVVLNLAIGVVLTIWPGRVQQYYVRGLERGPGRFNPFAAWMRSESYVFALRLLGVAWTAVSLWLLWLAVLGQ